MRFAILLVAGVIACAAVPARASIVIGNSPSDTAANCLPFGCASVGDTIQYQQVYRGDRFANAQTITAVSFTKWRFNGPTPRADYSLSLYYTQFDQNTLGSTISGNRGEFIGSFTSHIQYSIVGNMVFEGAALAFDPSKGNLLVDILVNNVTQEGSAAYLEDSSGADTQRLVIAYGRVFRDRLGLVTTFDVANSGVPEPATWAMMMLGFGLMGTGLRRRRLVTTSPA